MGEVANAIEREGEELRGLHSQLNDLLKESKERVKEDEVKNILSIIWNPAQVVAMLLSLQVQLDATLHTIDMFCQRIAQVGPISKGEFGHSCWIFPLHIHLSCHLSQHHKHNFHHQHQHPDLLRCWTRPTKGFPPGSFSPLTISLMPCFVLMTGRHCTKYFLD